MMGKPREGKCDFETGDRVVSVREKDFSGC